MPDQDAVVAITSGVSDMQAVLNLVWDKLLPAMAPASLPADPSAREKLDLALKDLSLRPQLGTATPPKVLGKVYRFPANDQGLESVALESSEPGVTTLVSRFKGVESRVDCGRGKWIKCQSGWGPEAQPVAASGAWTAEDTFIARLCLFQTPFLHTVTLKFTGDEVRLNRKANVGFGPSATPELVGSVTAGSRYGPYRTRLGERVARVWTEKSARRS
jgi:hypothetical protein